MPDGSLLGLSVLMTADTLGGVLTYALTLASELTRRGATVHVATMGAPMSDSHRRAAAEHERLVMHESVYALEWMHDPWLDVARAARWLRDLERDLAPDLVHLNGYCHAAAGFRAPVVVVGHSCVLSWWEAVRAEPAPSSWDRYRAEVKRGIEAAGAVIAPTEAMLRCLERHYGALPSPSVVANGMPAPPLAAGVTRERSVLAAGRLWDPAKNIEALARVAPRLTCPVRVAGELRRPDGSLEPLPDVEHLGLLDGPALGRAMQAATVFAHPARYEPFGLAPLEAALRGCALVLGDIPSLREVWGEAASYVDPEDHGALEATLMRYAEDEALRWQHAARAAARAATFTVKRMGDGTASVYQRLLGAREPGLRDPRGSKRGALPSCA